MKKINPFEITVYLLFCVIAGMMLLGCNKAETSQDRIDLAIARHEIFTGVADLVYEMRLNKLDKEYHNEREKIIKL